MGRRGMGEEGSGGGERVENGEGTWIFVEVPPEFLVTPLAMS